MLAEVYEPRPFPPVQRRVGLLGVEVAREWARS
jgi:hypothetical protein